MKVGKHISMLRQERGLTRNQLAKEARISTGYLRRIELGYEEPHIKTIARLAEILKIELGDILTGGK